MVVGWLVADVGQLCFYHIGSHFRGASCPQNAGVWRAAFRCWLQHQCRELDVAVSQCLLPPLHTDLLPGPFWEAHRPRGAVHQVGPHTAWCFLLSAASLLLWQQELGSSICMKHNPCGLLSMEGNPKGRAYGGDDWARNCIGCECLQTPGASSCWENTSVLHSMLSMWKFMSSLRSPSLPDVDWALLTHQWLPGVHPSQECTPGFADIRMIFLSDLWKCPKLYLQWESPQWK